MTWGLWAFSRADQRLILIFRPVGQPYSYFHTCRTALFSFSDACCQSRAAQPALPRGRGQDSCNWRAPADSPPAATRSRTLLSLQQTCSPRTLLTPSRVSTRHCMGTLVKAARLPPITATPPPRSPKAYYHFQPFATGYSHFFLRASAHFHSLSRRRGALGVPPLQVQLLIIIRA